MYGFEGTEANMMLIMKRLICLKYSAVLRFTHEYTRDDGEQKSGVEGK
jgi:hypothetical protein